MSSLRTSLVLMVALSVMLVGAVLIPQRAVVGEAAVREMASRSAFADLMLLRLRLSEFSTSPIFLLLVSLFFLNLVVVLARRAAPTFLRLKTELRSAESLDRWTSSSSALSAPLSLALTAHRVSQVLRGFGYKPRRAGDAAMWGVKNATAPLGFLLFHASFILLLLGSAAIWATRSVSIVRLTEGETFRGEGAKIVRSAPFASHPELTFVAGAVDPLFDRGEATDLAVKLVFADAEQTARVNEPAKRGATSILIGDVGLAPVVWLQDSEGFTIERAAVAAERSGATILRVGNYEVSLAPRVTNANFPSRDRLSEVPIDVTVRLLGIEQYRGRLRAGEIAKFDGGAVAISEVRYWTSLRVVTERGGSLLIVGFLFAVAGLVWRLLAQRREVALTWTATELRLAGIGEFFPLRFRDELRAIADELRGDR